MTPHQLRRIVAEEVRKALDEFRAASQIASAKSSVGQETIPWQGNREGSEHLDPTSTEVVGASSILQQTVADRWAKLRAAPKRKPNATRRTSKRVTDQ